jgi:hypothetical protein
MKAEPQKEHAWLQKLVGEWTFEAECSMGPDQPPMKNTGTETVRPLGEVWVLADGTGEMPDGSPAKMLITLGYDPKKQRFVGTFVGSMMTNMWVYEGTLDASGKILTLDTEGPNFADEGKTLSKYQDVIEVVSDDHRILSSRTLGPDGKWTTFMTSHYRRKK